jgi:hypothetical protein
MTASQNNWLLGRQVEVRSANLTHHVWNLTSPRLTFLLSLDLLLDLEFFLEFFLQFLLDFLLELLLDFLLEFFELLIKPDLWNWLPLQFRVCTVLVILLLLAFLEQDLLKTNFLVDILLLLNLFIQSPLHRLAEVVSVFRPW